MMNNKAQYSDTGGGRKAAEALWESALFWLFAVSAAGLFLWHAYDIRLLSDEWEHLLSARMVRAGMVPYRDFFQHHHPLMWYLFAPLLDVWGNSLSVFYAMRTFMLLPAAGTCYYIYRNGRLLGLARRAAVLAAVIWLMFPVVRLSATEFRPDNWMMFCFMAGLAYFGEYVKEKKLWRLQLSFMLFFISFLFLQKVIFLLLLPAAMCLRLLYRKEIKAGDLAKAAALPLGIAALLFAAMYYGGFWRDYWELNWLLNLKIAVDFHLGNEYYYMIWFGAALSVWEMRQSKDFYVRWFCAAYILLAVGFTVFRPWFRHYLLIIYPFLAIVLAAAAVKLRRWHCVAVLSAAVLWSAYYSAAVIKKNHRSLFHIGRFGKQAAYVLENSRADDLILGHMEESALSGLRLPASGYYWYSFVHMAGTDYYFFNRHELPDMNAVMKEKRPKIIISGDWRNCLLGEGMPFVLFCHYWRNMDYQYLNEHYDDKGFVYVRKD